MLDRVIAWYDARRSGGMVALIWVLSRLLILATFWLFEWFVVGDVTYYFRKIAAMLTGKAGLADTFYEYPTPVAWILTLPYATGLGTRLGYVISFVTLMMLLDALFTYALWRTGGKKHDASIDFWVVFVLLIGPLSYLRFDMLPAVLAGGALLAARRVPWVTGALTGFGAAIKLWPALLIPAFLSYKRDRKPAGIAFVVVGFGLALVSLLAGGWQRLISPLVWQSDRGLQVESIWATPLMVLRMFAPDDWIVDITRYQAYEILPTDGSGQAAISAWLLVSTIATVVGLATVVALFVLAFRHPEPSALAVGLIILATVAIMIVTNKTLSPQYVLWLGGPVAALLLARHSMSDADRSMVGRLAWQVIGLALLTHLVYPTLYSGLLAREGGAMTALATTVTAVRNLALVAFTVEVVWLAVQHLRSTRATIRTGDSAT